MARPTKTSPPGSARLFADSQASVPAGVHVANIDGASRGNPGPASYGVVLRDPDGKIVLELAKNIGRETNNVAEYFALLAALDYATIHGISSLRIRSDSELLVRQMQGRYKVKSASLKPLHERALKQSKTLAYFAIEHIPRVLNSDADALANVALDRTGEVSSGARVLTSSPSGVATRSASSSTVAHSASESRSIRARYKNGALHPAEPLDLAEGTEVEIVIKRREQ